LNRQFNNSLIIQEEFGLNTQNCDGTRDVERNLKTIGFQEMSKIRENSGISPRRLNMYFLLSKSKKLWQKEEAPGSS